MADFTQLPSCLGHVLRTEHSQRGEILVRLLRLGWVFELGTVMVLLGEWRPGDEVRMSHATVSKVMIIFAYASPC